MNAKENLKEYRVWDKNVRWFHWINVVCVLGLIGVGTVILYNKSLGISTDGKILLKTIHVYLGYIFLINLVWRLIWGFIGGKYARWKTVLPGGKGYICDTMKYAEGFAKDDAPGYLGHNPMGKLMIAALLFFLIIQGGTGLILAGTDIYYPPFGNTMKVWIAENSGNLVVIKPYSKVNVNEAKYKEMKSFRKPVIGTHVSLYYVLVALIFIHILAAIITDIRERNGIISSMFTGIKVFDKKPVDYDE